MKNSRTVGIAATLMVVALTWGVAPAASAAHSPQCSSGYSCLWQDQDWLTNGDHDKKVAFQFYIPNLGSHNYSGTSASAANSASSLTNKGNFERAYYYNNTACGNFQFSLGVNEGDRHLNDSRSTANNNLESTAFASYIASC